MWALPALMALALLPTVKNTLSGVCLSFPVAETASIIRAVKTVQSLTIVTEWRINMSKKCVCGNEMFTVFMCRKCEHLLYVEEDEDFPQNLRRISIVVTAQTKGNLERLAAVCGYSEIGRVVDKLTREKMISLHDFERKEKHHE